MIGRRADERAIPAVWMQRMCGAFIHLGPMIGTHTLLVLKVAYVAIVIFDVRVTMLLRMRDDISAHPRESAMVADAIHSVHFTVYSSRNRYWTRAPPS